MELDIYLKIKGHNFFVEQEFLRADNGGYVSLTDLLIQKENIIRILNNKTYE